MRIAKLDKKCPLCPYSNTLKTEVMNHFANDHRIKIQTKYFNFHNLAQFYEWKNIMEKDTTCRYVQNSKAVTLSGKRTTYLYICHRSGYYRNHNKGTRKVKYKGSNKINGFCPSELLVICEENMCEVHFVKTHIGHSNEIQRVSLTAEERDFIALKIASKVPFDKIVEDVRMSKNHEMSLDRLQLLTRKDLYNIAKRYKLKESAVLWDDRDVDTWAQETEGVLFYKAEGRKCEPHPFLAEEDFVLIIMNSIQKEIFDSFCHDLICVDSLAGSNDYFDLTTLMVRDDALCGFPCAFMFSNRADEQIIEFYFSCLREKVGKIETKAIMTDLTDSHYRAWNKIMGPPQLRLYCSWDVDKAWRARLNKMKSTEERRATYTALKNIQTESIEHKYVKMLDDFLNDENVDSEFRTNFAENFTQCAKLWACCYRVEDRVNEDTQLQQMHEHLKYIITYGKKQKPLFKTLNSVMRMVGDNLVNRRVILNSNETIYHLNLIQKRHRDSYLGNFDSIITVAEGWHVPSFTELCEPYELHFVQQVLKKCGCNYSCSECRICIHQFACSCIDNAVEGNMCKHIHLVIRYRDGKKRFILDEGSGKFKDINSDEDEIEEKADTSATQTPNDHGAADLTNRNWLPGANIYGTTRKAGLFTVTKEYVKKSGVIDSACAPKKNFIRPDVREDVAENNECNHESRMEVSDSLDEGRNEEVLIDNIVDTKALELSLIPICTESNPPSASTENPIHSHATVINPTIVSTESLEKKSIQLLKKYTNQIKKIKTFEQLQMLENILIQVEKIVDTSE